MLVNLFMFLMLNLVCSWEMTVRNNAVNVKNATGSLMLAAIRVAFARMAFLMMAVELVLFKVPFVYNLIFALP